VIGAYKPISAELGQSVQDDVQDDVLLTIKTKKMKKKEQTDRSRKMPFIKINRHPLSDVPGGSNIAVLYSNGTVQRSKVHRVQNYVNAVLTGPYFAWIESVVNETTGAVIYNKKSRS
jgi:hypothetical protein